jgi:hypothetical protein
MTKEERADYWLRLIEKQSESGLRAVRRSPKNKASTRNGSTSGDID